MNHTYHYHTPAGVFAAQGYAHAASARPKLDDRKRSAGVPDGRSICPGCEAGIYSEAGTHPVTGDAKAVGEVDRPNGLGIVVTLTDGTVVKAPYGAAAVFTCPACNRKPKQRSRYIDRIRQAHIDRIIEVGVRVG